MTGLVELLQDRRLVRDFEQPGRALEVGPSRTSRMTLLTRSDPVGDELDVVLSKCLRLQCSALQPLRDRAVVSCSMISEVGVY